MTGFDKLFFEQLSYNWITAHPATRPVEYVNSWFFFEIMVCVCVCVFTYMYMYNTCTYCSTQVKSMAQHLNKTNKLEEDRRKRFSDQFEKDLEFLVSSISSEIAEKHIKVLNTSPPPSLFPVLYHSLLQSYFAYLFSSLPPSPLSASHPSSLLTFVSFFFSLSKGVPLCSSAQH